MFFGCYLFIILLQSNDKLELAEKLHSEQHITKELGERLSQQEEELQELKDQVWMFYC